VDILSGFRVRASDDGQGTVVTFTHKPINPNSASPEIPLVFLKGVQPASLTHAHFLTGDFGPLNPQGRGDGLLRITGSPDHDILTGGSGNDVLTGGQGKDTLDGGQGSDTLTGGEGSDVFIVDATGSADVDRIADFQAGDTLLFRSPSLKLDPAIQRGSGSSGLARGQIMIGPGPGGVTNLYLELDGTGAPDLRVELEGSFDIATLVVSTEPGRAGIRFRDTRDVDGTPGADTLSGSGGTKFLRGSSGNDTYYLDDPSDDAIEVTAGAAGGIDTVHATVSHVLGPHLDKLVLGGAGAINGTGNGLDNEITGNAGNNRIDGGEGNDLLRGLGGNDIFVGLSGRDAIQGGDGDDMLSLNVNASQVAVAKLRGNGFLVRDTAGNMAIARDVEKIGFLDGMRDLSQYSVFGNADAELAQIYVAGFRRAPELGGFRYWAHEKEQRGLDGVAEVIFSLAIVKTIYPDAMAAADFVSAIYRNVFNRDPDAEGLRYWTDGLTDSSRGQLVVRMTSAALGTPDGTPGKDYFQNRVDWAQYAVGLQSTTQQEFTPDRLGVATSGVNENADSLLTLVGQAETGGYF
jgi:Ca2+-binding RTX toxin-like protein